MNDQASPKKKRRKPRKRGRANGLTPDLAEQMAEKLGEWGPDMRALPDDRWRAFVVAMFETKPGHGAPVRAAKMAGFGTTTSSPASWAAIASRLIHDDRVQAAMHEHGKKALRGSLMPQAFSALNHLVSTPGHRDHGRALGLVLDRAYPVETTHNVVVEDRRAQEPVTPELIARVIQIARSVGVDLAKLPPMIDVTPVREK
jgi:hypothetical protein